MQDSNLPSHKKFIPEANSDIFPLFIYKYSAAATQEAALGTYTFSSTSHRILKTFPLSVSTFVLGDGYAHALYSLSLVEDPLWKRVCADILTLMGPIAAQLFQAHLGVPHNKAIDLYCQTEEMLLFLHTYQFAILAALQRYFPFLQSVKIIHKTQDSFHREQAENEVQKLVRS